MTARLPPWLEAQLKVKDHCKVLDARSYVFKA